MTATHRRPALALPLTLLLTACVEQQPGLTVIVRVDPQPGAALALPDGSLTVTGARLFPGAVELLPCEEATARWHPRHLLIGRAHAHGEAGDAALSAAVEPIDALDDAPRDIARITVPPGLSLCGLRLGPLDPADEPARVGLAGHVDGAARDWLAPIETPPRLPLPPFALDADRREATVTLRFALSDWTAGLPDAPEPEQSRALAANAAAALTAILDPTP